MEKEIMFSYRWWFQIFFIFTPTWDKWSNLTNIFQLGWNHQLEFVFVFSVVKMMFESCWSLSFPLEFLRSFIPIQELETNSTPTLGAL